MGNPKKNGGGGSYPKGEDVERIDRILMNSRKGVAAWSRNKGRRKASSVGKEVRSPRPVMAGRHPPARLASRQNGLSHGRLPV